MQDAEPRIGMGETLRNLQGAITAAIFDDDHFEGIFLAFQERKCLTQGTGQAGFFIVSRDDNR